MIKIKWKQSNGLLNEASIRGLTSKYKISDEFANFVNDVSRQHADTLLRLYMDLYKPKDPTDDLYVQEQFKYFMKQYGNNVVTVLTRFPAVKDAMLDMFEQDAYLFDHFIKANALKAKLPSDFTKKIKAQYREEGEDLIEIYCSKFKYRHDEPLMTQYQTFIDWMEDEGDFILEVLRRFPAQKTGLVNLALRDYGSFMTDVNRLDLKKGEKQIVLKLDDDFVWVYLNTSYCSDEAKKMGHCGRAGASQGTLYSLRKIDPDTGEEQPYVTIAKTTDNKVHQIKGKEDERGSNKLPLSEFWPYIYEFFKHFKIRKEQVLEPLARGDEDFMNYFEGPKKTFEELFKELNNVMPPRGSENLEPEEMRKRQEKLFDLFKRIMKMPDIDNQEYLSIFEILYQDYDKNADRAMELFFQYYKKRDLEENMELLSKVVDYLDETGAFKTKDDIERVYKIMSSEFKVFDAIKEKYKDLSASVYVKKYTDYLETNPIVRKMYDISKELEYEENKKEMKEARNRRKMLAKAPFKQNGRGYFKLC